MPGPIEKLGAKAIIPGTDVVPGKTGTSARFQVEGLQKTAELPPLETGNSPMKEIERTLRKRIEAANTQAPQKLFGADLKDLRTRLDATAHRVEGLGGGIRERLDAIEAQYTSAEQKLGQMPDTNNLRELLAMQVEMYRMGHNIEILSKVVDAVTSGIKQTFQTQV
jgi:hypothetical protein